MNQGADEAAAIIGGVVERCGRQEIALMRVSIDAELASELGLTEGKELARRSPPDHSLRTRAGASGALRDGVNDRTGQYQRIRPAATALL